MYNNIKKEMHEFITFRSKVMVLFVLMIVITLVVGGFQNTGVSEAKPEIVIGKDPYSNEWPAGVIKHVSEELGYPAGCLEGNMGDRGRMFPAPTPFLP